MLPRRPSPTQSGSKRRGEIRVVTVRSRNLALPGAMCFLHRAIRQAPSGLHFLRDLGEGAAWVWAVVQNADGEGKIKRRVRQWQVEEVRLDD